MNAITFLRTMNGAYFFKMGFFPRLNLLPEDALNLNSAAHPKLLNTHAFSASKALLFVQCNAITIK